MISITDYIKKHRVKNVIDVGAHFGEWATHLWSISKDLHIFSIEANPDCNSRLTLVNKNSVIACLSDKNGIKPFYRTNEDLMCTGNSLYIENTNHYSDEKLNVIELETFTLDHIIDKYQPDLVFDFLKLDVQGSELDILKGASGVLKNVKIIQAETDVSGYNIGAPRQHQVVEYLKEKGFDVVGVVDNIQWNGKLLQQDLLFERV